MNRFRNNEQFWLSSDRVVAAAVGTSAGDSGYQSILDLGSNNTINNADLQIIALVLLNKE